MGRSYLSLKTGAMVGLCLILLSVVLIEKTYVSNGWLVSSKSVLGLLPYKTKPIAQLDKVTNVFVECETGSTGDATITEYYLYLGTKGHAPILLPTSIYATTSSNKAEALKTSLQQSLDPSTLHRWAFIMWPLGFVGAFIFLISGFLLLVKR